MKFKTFSLIFLTTTILFMSCKSDLNDLSKEIENASNLKLTSGILSISYDIKTTRDFEADFAQLSEIDLANVNPSEEKQNIKMNLLENGQLQISVTELPFEKK